MGAAPQNVIALVLKKGMMLVGVGIGVGLAVGFASGRIMQSLLFNVGATNFVTFGGVSVCLVVVASLSCIVPARRAVKVDPQEVLRVE